MNTLVSYILFTSGVLWYIVKYAVQFSPQVQNTPSVSLNQGLFVSVSTLVYGITAGTGVFGSPTVGIAEAVFIVITFGIALDLSYNSIPGKGYAAIVTCFSFFAFDATRKNDDSFYIAIITIWAIIAFLFVFGSLYHIFHFDSAVKYRSIAQTTQTTLLDAL